ncbi:hypothetical protein EVAR_61979_1 [Eumeta japonica]|uniref:Uncharacterized protein n=1 Tax=Eumeta variegata TaxID=151549 RepID=A0A4C1YGQ3_EUMVA|nr:hypothetical protein EVAR_61979_1 [Eumeta japonica]
MAALNRPHLGCVLWPSFQSISCFSDFQTSRAGVIPAPRRCADARGDIFLYTFIRHPDLDPLKTPPFTGCRRPVISKEQYLDSFAKRFSTSKHVLSHTHYGECSEELFNFNRASEFRYHFALRRYRHHIEEWRSVNLFLKKNEHLDSFTSTDHSVNYDTDIIPAFDSSIGSAFDSNSGFDLDSVSIHNIHRDPDLAAVIDAIPEIPTFQNRKPIVCCKHFCSEQISVTFSILMLVLLVNRYRK